MGTITNSRSVTAGKVGLGCIRDALRVLCESDGMGESRRHAIARLREAEMWLVSDLCLLGVPQRDIETASADVML